MKEKILIIDDAKFITALLSQFLSSKYDIIVKHDGLEALDYLQKGHIPNLIICDVNMPNINGYELVQHLQNSGMFKDIPILILSSLETSSERVAFLKMGVKDFMIKPFNPQELEVRIGIHLN